MRLRFIGGPDLRVSCWTCPRGQGLCYDPLIISVIESGRRPWAFCLAAFFCVAAAAPHRHLNAIADLVSDGRSNSGAFARTIAPADGSEGYYSWVLVQDQSCLACFNDDFVSSPTRRFVLATSFDPLPQRLTSPLRPSPTLVPANSPSRAPPAIA